jgi:hypothetical protein
MNIQEFKKGDIIVRVEPAKDIESSHDMFGNLRVNQTGDRSYIGDKMTYLGSANGCAYFDVDKLDKRRSLRLDIFSEGWEHWVDIESIDEAPNSIISYNLKKELKKALKEENFELLSELKKIFDQITKE